MRLWTTAGRSLRQSPRAIRTERNASPATTAAGHWNGGWESCARTPPQHRLRRMQSVRLQNIRKAFGPVVAIEDIPLEFEAGALTAVLGPSGCGKTTTLNLIAGFERPDTGTIHFGERLIADAGRGIAVPTHRRNLGMVFQSYALWPHLTVGENVAYGLKMRGATRAERDAAVKQALQSVRLESYLDRYPHELSGGQQQRVALARALAYAPSTLLFDEPLSNLDAHLREGMRVELN